MKKRAPRRALSLDRQIKLPWGKGSGRVGREDLVTFTEGLATLLGSGVVLETALTMLSEFMEKPVLKAIAGRLLAMVREGHSLSHAMGREKIFPPAYIGMVRAGERAGTLPAAMAELGSGLRRTAELIRTVVSSLIYPALLLVVSAGAVFFILTTVLPTFVEILEGMRIPLEPGARFLVWVGRFMEAWGLWLLLGVALSALGAALAIRRPAVRAVVDKALLRLGPVGRIIKEWQTVLYFRTLGFLVLGGVPLNEACRYATQAVSNNEVRASLETVVPELKEGVSLRKALSRSPYLPPLSLRMVAIGEQTGELGRSLTSTADYLEAGLKTKLGRLVTILEPLIILFMGLVVGAIVVIMLTTLISFTQGGMGA